MTVSFIFILSLIAPHHLTIQAVMSSRTRHVDAIVGRRVSGIFHAQEASQAVTTRRIQTTLVTELARRTSQTLMVVTQTSVWVVRAWKNIKRILHSVTSHVSCTCLETQ